MSRSGSTFKNPHHHGRRRMDDEDPKRSIHGFRRLPSGVKCPDCGAEWQPVCPNRECPANADLKDLPDDLARIVRRERRGRPHQRADR